MEMTGFMERRQRGTSMIEVLVAMVVLAVGLLGLVSLQAKLQVLQIESYQRAQALMLLNDMAARITLNRENAASYETPSPLGVGMTCPGTSATRQDADIAEWCELLQGVAETQGTTRLGAMAGARGCVEAIGANEYLVTVAWQGLAPVAAPPVAVGCGAGEYGAVGTACEGDACRRVVTTVVRIATLI
jgi:type IV pilus assembly protein PilV